MSEHPESAGDSGATDHTPSASIADPSLQYFRNKLHLEQLADLNHLESTQRLSLMRKYHNTFVSIADDVLSKLAMVTLKGKTKRSVAALGLQNGTKHISSLGTSPNASFASPIQQSEVARRRHEAYFSSQEGSFALGSFDSTIGEYMANDEGNATPRQPLTRNSLRNASFPVSTQPTHTQLYSSAVNHIDPERVIDVDVSTVIKRKEAKMKALARAFDEEERKAEAFRAAEQKRTEAFQRRKQFEKEIKLARTQKGVLNTHVSYIQLQKTKAEVEARENARNREKAIEARKDTIELQRKAQEETRRRMNILAADTVRAAQNEFDIATASVRNSNLKASLAQESLRHVKGNKADHYVAQKLSREQLYEDIMAEHNRKEAEKLERRQHISHGQRDALSNLRPHEVSIGKFGLVKNLPIDEVQNRPQFTPRTARSSTSNRDTSSSPSSSKIQSSSSPINPLTYQRLCGGRGPLNNSAIYEEAYGLGKRMTDLDSYYLLRGPQDVTWK